MQESINTKYIYSNKLCSTPQNKQKLKVTCDQAISLPIYIPHCFYFYYFRRWYEIISVVFYPYYVSYFWTYMENASVKNNKYNI